MGSPDFISGGCTVEKSEGNSEDFPVVLLKGVSLGLFDITLIRLAGSSKLGEEIGCMEGTSLGVSKIAIKGIPPLKQLYLDVRKSVMNLVH